MQGGGHRVYWDVKGVKPEEFHGEDNDFEELAAMGWFKRGRLNPDLALELKEKSQATRKPRQAVVRKPKRKHCSESEAESESDDDEEADDVEEEHAAAPEPARSINDRAGLYREIFTPRAGCEHYWTNVGRLCCDTEDLLSFTITAIVERTNGRNKRLLYKYYDNSKFSHGPPESEAEFEYTRCEEMDPEDSKYGGWAEWGDISVLEEIVAESSSDPVVPAVQRQERASLRPSSRWKGYAIVTQEEEEALVRQRNEARDEVDSRMRKRRK